MRHCCTTLLPVDMFFFFLNDTAPPETYPLPPPDPFPISGRRGPRRRRAQLEHRQQPHDRHYHRRGHAPPADRVQHEQLDARQIQREGEPHRGERREETRDRKSTRLNSSHLVISYAVFCLK